MMKYLYTLAIILGFASTAYAIHCHVCSSAQHPDCKDAFKAGGTYDTDCNKVDNPINVLSASDLAKAPDSMKGPAKGCLKLELEAGGVLVTNRVCYWGDPSDAKEGCKITQGLLTGPIKQKSCDVCTKDLCNSSTTTGVFATTVMCLVFLLRMMS